MDGFRGNCTRRHRWSICGLPFSLRFWFRTSAQYYSVLPLFISALAATQELQLPLASADGLGLSAAEAGLAMMPGGVLMIGLAPVSSKVTRRWGAKATLASGAIVIAIGYVLRVLLTPTLVNIVIGAAVVSAGVAFSLAAMPTLITESAPIHQTASANGFNSLLRSVGTSTGSAVAAAVLASSTVVIGASAVPTLHSFAVLYWIGAGVSALAAAVTLAVKVERTGAVSLPELPIAAETDGATKIGVSRRTDPIFVVTVIFDWNQPGTRDREILGDPGR